jgi:ribosomal protein S18 acetylase RimI-like enzyme
VRRAAPADFERVAALTLDAYRGTGQLGVESGYERSLADVATRAADAEVLVAMDPPDLVGTVTFVLPGGRYAELSRPGEAEFRMLAVDPRAQRRGVGEALVRACIARARDERARAVVISTTPLMAAAGRLYRRLGFVRTPELDWTPTPGVDLLAMRLDLAASAHEVEGDGEGGRAALVVGHLGITDDEPTGVQGEDRQR